VLLFNTLLNEDQPGQGGEGDEGAKNILQVHGHVLAWEVDSLARCSAKDDCKIRAKHW